MSFDGPKVRLLICFGHPSGFSQGLASIWGESVGLQLPPLYLTVETIKEDKLQFEPSELFVWTI